jgi:AcrR family transcriptional regulator
MPKMILEYKKAVISKIVETALEIFSTKGYQELTMDEIAKRLGVSKGALYSYFTSKEEILKEIYKNGRQIIQKILSTACEGKDFNQVMETIFKLMTEKYENDIRIYFEILAIASHNENFKEILKDDYEKDLKATKEFIEKLANKGQFFSKIDSKTLAQLFRSIWMGMSEKLVLGYDSAEIHESWIKSISSVLGVHTTKS